MVTVIKVFTISPQYKNANIANFVMAAPLKIKKTNKVCNLESNPFTTWNLISLLLTF